MKTSKIQMESQQILQFIRRKMLREVKQSGEIHLVVDCEHDKIEMVMREAQAVGMMTAYHNYLITNMVRS
jgi:hypothetical protein